MNCPYCRSENTSVFFERKMPAVLSAYSGDFPVKVSELQVSACKDCLLGFASKKLSSEELTEIYGNYLYISPLNNIGTSKYHGMIDTIISHFDKDERIVEIGCSEGYLLTKLSENGFSNVTGIEPGPQADIAKSLGLNVTKDYFNASYAQEKVDGYYLMHVFEHFEDPFSIFKLMSETLNDTGRIVIEVPNFCGFHVQHLFYYNIYFMQRLAGDNGLKIIYHRVENDSLRVVFVKAQNSNYSEIDIVFDRGLFIDNLSTFKQRCDTYRNRVNNFIRQTDHVVWWGAGSASIILLNEIDKEILDNADIAIVDGDKNKADRIIPGLGLKVSYFETIRNTHISNLVIASSFYKEIFETMKVNGITYDRIEVFSDA